MKQLCLLALTHTLTVIIHTAAFVCVALKGKWHIRTAHSCYSMPGASQQTNGTNIDILLLLGTPWKQHTAEEHAANKRENNILRVLFENDDGCVIRGCWSCWHMPQSRQFLPTSVFPELLYLRSGIDNIQIQIAVIQWASSLSNAFISPCRAARAIFNFLCFY